MADNDDFSQALGDYFPLDGPYDAEKAVEATKTIHEVTRYLNRAAKHAQVLKDPAIADSVIEWLSNTAVLMSQLIDKLADSASNYSLDPGIYDDRDMGTETGQKFAQVSADRLEQARCTAQTLSQELGKAGYFLSHLGYRAL